MKIYEIGTGYTPIPAQMGAATEIVVEDLTRALIKNGHDVEIIDIQSSEPRNLDLPLAEVKVPSVFTKKDVSLGIMHKLKRVIYSVALARKLKKILKNAEEKVVLHFHNQYNLFFFYKLMPKQYLNKAFVAYTVHSYVWNDEWSKIETTVNKRYFQEIFCVKNADAVFVLNDITKKHFVDKLSVDKERVYSVINGVNPERYFPMSEDKIKKSLDKYGLSGKKVIFQVGSVCERKNQLFTVKSLADYLKNNRGVVYMYAGGIIDAEYKQKIDDYAKENDIEKQIMYVGELTPGQQLNEYYNMASCCVFTATHEAFSLVIIEAITAGTPVILANNLKFDFDNCYRAYNNADEFVSLVEDVVKTNDLSWFDCNGVREKFNWGNICSMYMKVFNEIH
ncbi:MAG: glycosyltransferase family 4 protein [Clostridia bacterium]|nr:glycosyltransferase family 4 protein [Clostridia bacterium]